MEISFRRRRSGSIRSVYMSSRLSFLPYSVFVADEQNDQGVVPCRWLQQRTSPRLRYRVHVCTPLMHGLTLMRIPLGNAIGCAPFPQGAPGFHLFSQSYDSPNIINTCITGDPLRARSVLLCTFLPIRSTTGIRNDSFDDVANSTGVTRY